MNHHYLRGATFARFLLGCVAAAATSVALAAGSIEVGENHSVSVGAGLRTAFTGFEDAAPSGEDYSTNFDLQSVRLYIGGQIHEKVKFTFNTECKGCVFGEEDDVGAGGAIIVLDAIAQFEFRPEFNIWMGRMLTPADRIELNGPYYGLSWNQYTVPLLPSDQLGDAGLLGRDDGATAWGAINKFQYAVGLFDGVDGGPNQEDNLLFSGRIAYNFLNMESNPGFYTSSTYFGALGDILTFGLAYQNQKDGTGTADDPGNFEAIIVDVLFEKVFGNDSVLTIEGEYKIFDADLTAEAISDPDCFCLFDGDSYFITAAFMFPNQVGWGKFQPYLRYTSNEPDFGDLGDTGFADSDLTELGVNYIINGHNLRLNLNVTDGDANLTGLPGSDGRGFSLGVQVQI